MNLVYYERLSQRKCIVKGCAGTSQLFAFPRIKKKYEEWLNQLNEPALDEVKIHQIMKYCRICIDHFEDICFEDQKQIPKTLRPNAVPTLRLDPFDYDSEAEDVINQYVDKHKPHLLVWSWFNAILSKSLKRMPIKNIISILQFDFLPINSCLCKNSRIVVVFMLRGLFENWKQLYTYVVLNKGIEIETFALCVLDAMFSALYSGFNVVAIGCKPTSFNMRTMDHLSAPKAADDPKHYEYIALPGKRVIILYDPPSLLINLRNEFAHLDLQFQIDKTTYIASWKDIEIVHEDSKKEKCQLLTDEHVYYSKFNKKSVRYAAQVFSGTVGQSLLDYAKEHQQSKLLTMESTSALLMFFNTLFDSVNGYIYTPPKHKPLYKKVFRHTEHFETWGKSAKILDTMFFIRPDGERIKTGTLKKWRSTIYGVMKLWNKLVMYYEYNEFVPRRLNLDPLDNDLTRIRFHHIDTDKTCKEKLSKIYPNCTQFRMGFQYVLENGTNFLSPLYFTFSYPLYLHRRDLDFEKNPDETIFNCLEDNCSSILAACNFNRDQREFGTRGYYS